MYNEFFRRLHYGEMPEHLMLIYGFGILSSGLLGLLILYKDNKSPVSRSFFAFTLCQIVWSTVLYLGYYFTFSLELGKSLIFMRLAYGFGIMMYPCLVLFFYYFPKITFNISLKKGISFLLFHFLLFIVASFTPFILESQNIIHDQLTSDNLGILYVYFLAVVLLDLIFATFLVIKKILSSHEIERWKIIISAVGYCIFLLLVVITNGILPIFNIYILQEESPIFSLFFIIPTFYALHRYRFFNLSYISLKFLRKIILFASFVGLIVLSSYSIEYFLPKIDLVANNMVSLLLSAIIISIFDKLIPDFVNIDFREFRKSIKLFLFRIYNCDTYNDFYRVAEDAFTVKLNISNIKIFALEEKAKIKNGIPTYIKNDFTNAIEFFTRDIVVKNEIKYENFPQETKSIILGKMNELDAELCIPLFSENKLIGFLTLGHKENNASYSKEEIEEIFRIKHGAEICLMNILLKYGLQKENILLNRIIKEKTQELEKTIQQQKDFISMAAHELRTPLTSARFAFEIALEENKNLHKIEMIQLAHKSIDNLVNLIEQLFSTQQYDLDKIQLKASRVNISKFTTEVYNVVFPRMEEKSQKLILQREFNNDFVCTFDKTKIKQVLVNLLVNASKFTPKDTEITLKVNQDKDSILFCVIDNGKGIPDPEKKIIFEKLHTRKLGTESGFGFGLYISKKIVEMHKGEIWVEDSPSGGAIFCVKLDNNARN